MPSFNLSTEYINRISRMFKRYRKIRSLISRNVDEYIYDFTSFKGTPEERAEYLESKYRPKAPQENYLAVVNESRVLFHVKDIALLTAMPNHRPHDSSLASNALMAGIHASYHSDTMSGPRTTTAFTPMTARYSTSFSTTANTCTLNG